MGVDRPRSLYQYKPVVQKHGKIGKNAYTDAISLHAGTAQVALISKPSVVAVANGRCATAEQDCTKQSFDGDFFTSPRDKVPAAGFFVSQ